MIKEILSHKELSLPEKIKFAVKVAESLKKEAGLHDNSELNDIEKVINPLKEKMNNLDKLQQEVKIKSAELKEYEMELDNILNRISGSSNPISKIKFLNNEY